MQQIPVRGVNLQNTKARAKRSPRRGGKLIDDTRDLFRVERMRDEPAVSERNCAWGHDAFPSAVLRSHGFAAFPRRRRARLESGMRELHAGYRAVRVNELDDLAQFRNVFVAVNAEIHRGNAPFRRDRGRLGEDECRAAYGATPQMHDVPVVRKPVFAGILAHRRDDDPVSQGHAAYLQRLKQVHP